MNIGEVGKMRIISCLLLIAFLNGCGAAAAPCRVASAGIKVIPVVGDVAAMPTDGCADVIDPLRK